MTEERSRWLRTIIAGFAIVFGVLALGKPYWTLENMAVLLAIIALLLFFWQGAILHRSLIGIVAVGAAVGLAFSRETAVMLLVYGVLVYVLAAGVHALTKFRGRNWYAGALGLACILFGVMGAYWIDVTSIIVGLLLGPIAIITGILLLLRAWRAPDSDPNPKSSNHSGLVLAIGRIGAVVMLLLAGTSAFFTVRAIDRAPQMDSFAEYSQPVGNQPGVLLKAERFDRGMPDNSVATRILYTTTGMDGAITLATGLVIVPVNAPPDPLPVILWAHGTTGVDVQCGPTVLGDPLGAGAMMFPDLPLNKGWAIVAPDYLGLGASAPHPYLVGKPAAHSSFDAIRAARQLDSVSLSDDTVVWGHSQGGGTALWIGIEAESYALDIPLRGVAAMSPASNLPAFIDTLMNGLPGPIFGGYIIKGYSDAYDDVVLNDYVRPGARFSQQKMVQRCLSEPSFLANLVSAVIRESYTHADVHNGPLYERLQQNVPSDPLGVPLFLGQGEADPLISPVVQAGYVASLCESGQVVEYHTYPGLDHMGVVQPDSPMLGDLMEWTQARFAGDSAPETCSTNGN